MFDNLSDVAKNRKFERDVIPCLADYTGGTSFSRVLQDHEWLKDFVNPDSSFAATMGEFEHDSNRTTITLADFVKHLAGTVIAVTWQEKTRAFIQTLE
jgi:hypothetical protein